MAKILLAGEVVAEKQYLVDRIPAAKEVGIVWGVNCLTSSKILNAGRVLAKDNDVTMFGMVGNDDNGKRVFIDLKQYNISSKYVYSTPEAPTGQVLVITNAKGESAFILHLSASNYFDNKKLKSFSEFDWIYMASSMKLSQVYRMIERAEKENVKVFLDFPNQQKQFNKRKLKSVSFVVPNKQEAELLLDLRIVSVEDALTAVTKLKSFTNGNAVITLDKDGCVVFGSNWEEPKHYKTSKVKPIDDTGSGDIMRGVLLREYLKNNDLDKSVRIALRLATQSLKYKGVNASILAVN